MITVFFFSEAPRLKTIGKKADEESPLLLVALCYSGRTWMRKEKKRLCKSKASWVDDEGDFLCCLDGLQMVVLAMPLMSQTVRTA